MGSTVGELPDGFVALAYCVVLSHDSLMRYGQSGFLQSTCDRVDCRYCAMMGRLLQHYGDPVEWVCSECANHYDHHVGFWADGECEICGQHSIVLQMVEPLGNLKDWLRRMQEEIDQ